MPVRQTTIIDLRRITVKFEFLLDCPRDLPSNLDPSDRTCFICLEPFHPGSIHDGNTDATHTDGTNLNFPVRLPSCGHFLGFQCLAHLVFATSMEQSNRCPACQAPIVTLNRCHQEPRPESWEVTAPLLRVLMIFGYCEFSGLDKAKALDALENGFGEEMLTTRRKCTYRLRVLYAEFLDRFCEERKQRLVEEETAQEQILQLATLLGEAQTAKRLAEKEASMMRLQADEAHKARQLAEKRAAATELKASKTLLANGWERFKKIQERLNMVMHASEATISFSWMLATLGAAVAAVLAYLNGSPVGFSVASRISLLLLFFKGIVVFLESCLSKVWLKIFGSAVICMAISLLGLMVERERFLV